MRRFGFLCVLMLGLTTVTFAGSEQYSGKDTKQVATTAAPSCPNWTGFYMGAMGGYKFGISNPDLNLGGDWPTFPADARELESRGDKDLDMSGAELGGLIGYNYQMNNWVFGLEGTGGYLWLRNSNVTDVFAIPASGDTYHLSSSFKTHYLATFGPRIGYAVCRWLPYVTGGLAVGDLQFDQQITEHNTFFREGGERHDNNVGWMVGGGLEYSITDHWSGRLQYQYIDLGSVDFSHVGTAPFAGFTGTSDAELREHNVSLALIYKF